MKKETEDIKFWKQHKGPVIGVLMDLRSKRQLKKVCRERLDDLNPARLSEMIKGDTDVSSYYVGKFIQGGIMTLDHILQGKDFSKLPQTEKRILMRLALDDETVDMILDLENQGFKLKNILSGLLAK